MYSFIDDIHALVAPTVLPFAPTSNGHLVFKVLKPQDEQTTENDKSSRKRQNDNTKNDSNKKVKTSLVAASFSDPTLEVYEDDKNFAMTIDLPGVKASDISIKVEQEQIHNVNQTFLHVSGSRKRKALILASDEDSKDSAKKEQVSETRFAKRFKIDENVDVDKFTADLTDGVLTLTAPKKAPPAPVVKEIKITMGEAGNSHSENKLSK